MLSIKCEIDGSTGLLCNKFGDEAAMKASSGNSTAMGASDRGTPLDIAKSKLYIGGNGKPCIPQPNLLRCLVDGGQFHKAGKKQITTKKESMLYSCFDIEGAEIEIIHKQPWRVDTRPVVIPSTGGRILCHRPIFDDWKLRFVLQVDTDIIGAKLARQIVDDAGKRVGLGDYRPARKGPFGRFVVTLWQEQKLALAA